MDFWKWIDQNIEKFLLLLLMCITVIAVFIQVLMRNMMGFSLPWSEELARYCFIWLVFIGTSYGVKMHRHLKIDFAISRLNDIRKKAFLNCISHVSFLIFAVFIIINGHSIVLQLITSEQVTPSLQIPMWLVYIAAPIGMGLTVIRIIQQLIIQIQTLRGKASKVEAE